MSWFTPSERRLGALLFGLTLLGTGLRGGRQLSPEVEAWLAGETAVPGESLATAPRLEPPRDDGAPAPPPDPAPPPPAPGPGKVDPNQAGESELVGLPGVGPVLARRILEDRGRNGPYRAPEDLLRIPGIGRATLARMRPHLAFPSPGGRSQPPAGSGSRSGGALNPPGGR